MKEEIKVLLFAHDSIENLTETINKLLDIIKLLNKKKKAHREMGICLITVKL